MNEILWGEHGRGNRRSAGVRARDLYIACAYHAVWAPITLSQAEMAVPELTRVHSAVNVYVRRLDRERGGL